MQGRVKRGIGAFFVALLVFLVAGCSQQPKKPAPSPKPLTTDKVTMEEVDPEKAPAEVKEIVAKQKENPGFHLVRSGSSLYLVVTRGRVPSKEFGVQLKGMEKIDLGNGRSQVRVDVVFTHPRRPAEKKTYFWKEQKKSDKTEQVYYPVAVAKLTLGDIPDAFTYNVIRDPATAFGEPRRGMMAPAPKPEVAPGRREARTEPPAGQQPAAQTAEIQVTAPASGDTVTSPLTVTGKAKVPNGLVYLELRDSKDKVLAAKTVTASRTAPDMGDFTTTLTFTPPTAEEKGGLRVYGKDSSGQIVGEVKIPVTIK